MNYELYAAQFYELQAKRFAAPARPLDVRIVEDELGGQLALDKVHFGAEQRQLRLSIDQDADAVLEHFLV